ncbi:MAG: type 1 glutamine amidotransferase [Patescibacteria group bacterium]|nr:type 1 glutamine amidotransferase [Patescibacteria group bacterium]MDE2438162.1 type 1 glutamine amidotransferase [Patescibacteria group bacterium]
MKNKKLVTILFFDILTPDEAQKIEFSREIYNGGTYSESVRRRVGLGPDEWVYCDAPKGVFPKDLSQFDGVIIGGSTGDPIQGSEKSWMRKTYPFIRKLIRAKIPLLGICGGLQFTVRALGGDVILNPKGRELGTIRVALTKSGKQDPLFRGLPHAIFAQSSHKCIAGDLLPDWVLLGSSKLCIPQAIGIHNSVRLLQFHPEKKASYLKRLVRTRKNTLLKEGFVKNEAQFKKFVASIKNEDRIGKKILHNFVTQFVMPYAQQKTKTR